MGHKRAESREQVTLLPIMLDDLVGSDVLVRVMDALIESLDMQTLGFQKKHKQIGWGAHSTRQRIYSSYKRTLSEPCIKPCKLVSLPIVSGLCWCASGDSSSAYVELQFGRPVGHTIKHPYWDRCWPS